MTHGVHTNTRNDQDLVLGVNIKSHENRICRAYHFFDNMVDAHCVRDEGGFRVPVQWLRFIGLVLGLGYTIYRPRQPCCRKSGKVPSFFFIKSREGVDPT